jgi:hypothetical protein
VARFSKEDKDGEWRNVGLYSNVISIERLEDV